MGVTKKGIHNDSDLEIANFARLLSHPARIQILRFIIQQGSCTFNLIDDEVKLSRQTVRRHVAILEEGALIRLSNISPHVAFCIDPDIWHRSKKVFNAFFEHTISGFNITKFAKD